jgi:peptide/nickel transport system substrate-binding protein
MTWPGHGDRKEDLTMCRRTGSGLVLILSMVAIPSLLGPLSTVLAQAPRNGGELVFVVGSEMPSYDGHREETFGLMHPIGPHYNTLLRVDPTDPTGTRIIGDLAESWTVAKDGLTYTFKIRRGVKFHDGSPLTARDIKASYDHIINPGPGGASPRKGQYAVVEAVEASDDQTVHFRLKHPSAGLLSSLASPWNFVYKAEILAKDPRWYEKNIMGTGPFTFVEHVRGSHWVGKKFADYWDMGKPYLDSYRAIFIPNTGARVAAVRAERAMIEFRGFNPARRDELVKALGSKITAQESAWDCALFATLNHERKPFDDPRVRRALTLAADRWEGSKYLSRITILRDVGGVQVPGTTYAASEGELTRLAGFGKDIEASRKEARRLLREAGVPDGFSFVFTNRGLPEPYEPAAIWLIDQWRKIGLNATQRVLESAAWFGALRSGDFEVSMDGQCGYIVEPDLDLYKFLSADRTDASYGRYVDRQLDSLYDRQARARDPEERRKLIREFEKRLLDDQAHIIPTLFWYRVVPHNARVRGWTITPSHFLNTQLDTVWLAPE